MEERRINPQVLAMKLDTLGERLERMEERLAMRINEVGTRTELSLGDHEKRIRILEKAHMMLLGAMLAAQALGLYIYDLLRGGKGQ